MDKIKLKIDIELMSEDVDKNQRLVMDLISEITTVVNKEVNKKNSWWRGNSQKINCKYNTFVEQD